MSELQFTSYVFTTFNILDEYQLENYIRTFLGQTILFNNLRWDSEDNILTIYTTEEAYSLDTYAQLQGLLVSYPNAEIDSSNSRGQRAVNTGDLVVYDGKLNRQVVIPKGSPGQILTVDPLTETGIGWADFSPEGSTGGSLTTTDDFIRYLELYCSSSDKLAFEVPTSLCFNIERRKDAPTFIHDARSSEFSTTEEGTHMISLKVGFQWSSSPKSDNARIRVRAQVKPLFSASWENVQGALAFCTLDSRYDKSQTSTFFQFPRYCAAGDTFRIICVEESNTNNVETSGQSLVSVCKILVGGILYDTSAFLFCTNASVQQSISPEDERTTDVNFSDNITITGIYTRDSDSVFKVSIDSGFYIMARLTLETSGGNVGDTLYCEMQLLTDYASSGSAWSPVTGGSCNIDLMVSENCASRQQGSICCIPLLPANSLLKIQLTILDQSNPAITVNIVREATCFYSVSFSSTDVNSELKCLDIVSTYQNPINEVRWTDLQLDMPSIQDTVFTQDPLQTLIQCSDSGTYLVFYRVTAFLSTGGDESDTIGSVSVRLCINGSQGFYEAVGSRASATVTAERFSTVMGSSLLNLGYNCQLKLQALLSNVGSVKSTDMITTVPNQVEFIMAKLENTKVSLPAPGLLVYGSFHGFTFDDSTTSTTGAYFTEKLTLTTGNVPHGTYKVAYNYIYTLSSLTERFIARVLLDDVTVVSEISTAVSHSDAENNHFQFEFISLTPGIHKFSLQWKASNPTTPSSIRACKMEIFRVR